MRRKRKVIEAIVKSNYLNRLFDLVYFELYYSPDNFKDFSIISPSSFQIGWKFIDDSHYDQLDKIIEKYSVISLSVPLNKYNSFDDIVYEKKYNYNISLSKNEHIKKIAEKLQEKIIFQSNIFGNFIYDRDNKEYEVTTSWNKFKVSLYLRPDDEISFEKCHVYATDLFERQENIFQIIKELIIDDYFDIIWDTPKKKLSKEQFFSKLNLSLIVVSENDSVQFWFSDGGFFGGHSILVRGSILNNNFYAGLEG
jgi:hypothetical protein